MSKHTPRPWKVESSTPDGARVVAIAPVAWCGANSSFGVGTSQSISAKQARANAHLISAAPELLEALQVLMNLNDNHGLNFQKQEFGFGGEMYQDRIDRAWTRARTAIAKAKGKTE